MDEASVALAQAVVNKMKIYAPQTGILGLRQVSVGDFLAVGAPIVNVERLDPIKVDFRVPEIFAPAVKRGQSINISVDALPDQSFAGEVIAIDPKIDVNGRNMVVRAVLSNPRGDLLPGMFDPRHPEPRQAGAGGADPRGRPSCPAIHPPSSR